MDRGNEALYTKQAAAAAAAEGCSRTMAKPLSNFEWEGQRGA